MIVEPPHVDVRLARGAWVEPEAMLRQIRRAGFEAIRGDIRLVVTGALVADSTGTVTGVALDSMAVARTLSFAGTPPDSLAKESGAVEIEGTWDEKAKRLQPEAWRRLTPVEPSAPSAP